MAVTRLGFLALLCLIGLSATFASPNSRIIGGWDVVSGDQPWVASIRVDNAHVCTGTIICKKRILTAAHCVSQLGTTPIDAKRITVRIGSVNQYAGGEIREIEEVRIHPSYGNFLHDVALLFFTESLEFNDKYNKIWFAGAEDVIEGGSSIMVAGWGLLSTGATPYKLQEIKMSVLSAPECEYEAGYGYESILCLQHPVNEGICRGDDGAGVYVDGILYGVISFAFGSCGTKYPDIASKVSYYEEWINNNH